MTEIQSEARAQLIEAGRELFLRHEYNRVSIRRLADHAGVNSAMIAYYFGNKDGLFRAVVLSYFEPVKGYMLDGLSEVHDLSFATLFRFFFNHVPPELVQLLIKSVLFEPGDQSRWQVESLFRPLLKEVERRLDEVLPDGAAHHPEFARLAMQSLLAFPMLMKPALEAVADRELDADYFDAYADYLGTLLDRAFNLEPKP